MSDVNALTLRPVDADVYVGPQLGPEHMAEVARAGFRSVVNNRPDFEGGPDQPQNADIAAAAEAAGLEYRFLPVGSSWQTQEDVAAFGALLAFCRSGTRSARLYQLAQQA